MNSAIYTFPGHTIYPFFYFEHMYTIQFFRSPVHHKLKVDHQDFLKYTPGPSLHITTVLCDICAINIALAVAKPQG